MAAVSPQRPLRDLVIFDPILLKSPTTLAFALAELQHCDLNPNTQLDDLLSKPYLLEFIISVTNNASAFQTKLLANFSVTPHYFLTSALAKMLPRLSASVFLNHSMCGPPEATLRTLREYHRIVEHASQALQEIASVPSFSGQHLDEFGENQAGFVDTRIKINPRPFMALGYCIPTTHEDADKVFLDILRRQKLILEFYFNALRQPDIAESIKNIYIPLDSESTHRAPIASAPALGSELLDLGVNTNSASQVQPMTSALYFESPKAMGEWQILISSRADKYLREARRRDKVTFKIVLNKIRELSKGYFSQDNHKRLDSVKSEIGIHQAKLTRDLRLVYQIDCIPELESKSEKQVIKIFGAYTQSQLKVKRLWDSLSAQLSRNKDYSERCKLQIRGKEKDDVVLPRFFPLRVECAAEDTDELVKLPEEDLEEVHSLLVLEKYVSVSQALLYSIFADQEVQHIFQVSYEEQEIIQCGHSCYVLGRSGTGKTTCMLFKMVANERAWRLQSPDSPRPRQLFVTKSNVLAGKVEEYFDKHAEALRMAGLSIEELRELSLANKSKEGEDDVLLVNREDREKRENKLPARFSMLKETHFPLFITFDLLCSLVMADIAVSEDRLMKNRLSEQGVDIEQSKTVTSRPPQQQTGTLISYSIFRKSYWPHLSQKSTKGMDSFLIFTEFVGVIKGSEDALRNEDGFLSRSDYANLAARSKSTFASLRDVVYSMFESYLRLKRARGDYDAADRVHTLVRFLQEKGVPGIDGAPGEKIDFLYVDEAQDNLLIDAFFLRALCKNPNGLFWAGDTAQTISAGSSFTFNELKALMYRIEARREEEHPYIESTGIIREEPKLFQLLVNYRSHAGIINCAHSVIELITNFWPNAIDSLAPEKGKVDGTKPIFFRGRSGNEAQALEQFIFGATDSYIEFGAQQCILVRNQNALDNLRERGINCSMMTLYDSKGLEFNDVLLYNFFQDSAADVSQWRVILNVLAASGKTTVPAPDFDETRHAIVCNELKFLYVAITRARKNLWIIDSSEASEPIQSFWSTRNLVETCLPGMVIPHLAQTSSQEEWAMQGKEYFEEEQYIRAMECFEKAGMPDKVAITRAYHLREEARATPSWSSLRPSAFDTAARAFTNCATSSKAARRDYLLTAAECYDISGKPKEAAEHYRDAGEYDLAALKYSACDEYAKAVDVVRKHEYSMGANVINKVFHSARLYYFSIGNLDDALTLFKNAEDALRFTEEHKLADAQLALLLKLGRLADAGELQLLRGRVFEAIRLFLQDSTTIHSTDRAIQVILQGLWRNVSLWNYPKVAQTSSEVQELLQLASEIAPHSWQRNDVNELTMFRSLLSQDLGTLWELGNEFYKDLKNPTAAVMCLDNIFGDLSQIKDMITCDFLAVMKTFRALSQILNGMTTNLHPCKNSSLQKLLAFQEVNTGVYRIPRKTYLYAMLKVQRVPVMQSSGAGKLVAAELLSRLIKHSTQERVEHMVSNIIQGIQQSMRSADNRTLPAASMFIRHIVEEGLPIKSATLCDFIDFICGYMVFSVRTQEEHDLNGVTLPRNWLLELSSIFKHKPHEKDGCHLFLTLLAPIGEILERIHSRSSTDQIILEHLSVNEDQVVFRICRALGLLGHNISSSALKLQILRVMTSHDDSQISPHLSRPYCEARNWEDIRHALCARGNASERIIQLVQKSATPLSAVRSEGTLTFESISDIESALKSTRKPVATSTARRNSISSEIHADTRLQTTSSTHHKPAHETAVEEERMPSGDETEIIEFKSSAYTTWALGTTPQEGVRAATIIQKAYRRSVTQRKTPPNSTLFAQRVHLFSTCLAEVQGSPQPLEGYYRKLFLGPLPHLLLCLEEAQTRTATLKRQAKKRTTTTRGQELGDTWKEVTNLTDRAREIQGLQKLLMPTSDFHKTSDSAALSRYASQVEDIIARLPAKNALQLRDDLAIAMKGIHQAGGGS